MVTVKEVIMVSRDDMFYEMYNSTFTEKDGWIKKEDSESTTWSRIKYFGQELDNDERSD